jgi:hypothetical protein
MLYQQLLFELAWRDLQLVSLLFLANALLIFLPSMFAGFIARRFMLGSGASANGQCFRRCWFVSLVSFLVMVVVGLAWNWREAKQSFHRVDWFVATLCLGVVAPFFAEVYHLRASSQPAPEVSTRRRWRVSLRTILLVQLILLVAGGIWLGGMRDEIASQYENRRVAAEQRMLQRECDDRFAKFGWTSALVFTGHHYQLQLAGVANPHLALAEVTSADQTYLLQIGSPNLTDSDLQKIGKLSTLQHLNIGGGGALGPGLCSMGELKELKILWLNAKTIDPAGLAAIAQLPKLEELYIWCDQVSDDDLEVICKSASLRVLRLESGAVTDRSLPALEANRSLQTLILRKSQISRAAAVQLKAKRPELTGWWNQLESEFDW